MITFFCPHCWKEVAQDAKRCPYCGADITEFDKKSFEEKLIDSLNHPIRDTVQRAVWILGRLKSYRAVNPLIKLFEQSDNPYLKREILEALYEIGVEEGIEFIKKALKSEISMVRKKAEEIIK
ncbi:MAG: HEAT repeat domain-containing protein [Caldimicrobium sp.]